MPLPEESNSNDVWEQDGENALSNLTSSNGAPDPDFDDVELFSAANNVNGPSAKKFAEKCNFTPSGTLNILSPAIDRRNNKTFVKTINTPYNDDSDKVINLAEHNNLEQNIQNTMKHSKDVPDKLRGLHMSRESSVTNDLNSTGHVINDFNIIVPCDNSHFVPDDVQQISHHNVSTEWEGLEREIVTSSTLPASPDTPMILSTPLFSYQEAVQHFKNIDLSIYEPDIMTSIHLTGIAKFFAQLCGPPRLKSELKNEKTFVFCLARCQFDNEDPKDFQLLMTIYKCLTGTTLDCARYGSHWQDIGFQGSDPATDLRGTGMLSLLTILYFVREQKSLAHKLYQLSQNEVQNFPFCIFLINITKIALVALRNGYLNKECNKRFAILPIVVDVFSALTYEHYKIWKNGSKTIRDSGFVLKRLEEKTRSSSQCTELVNNFKKYCNERDKGIYEKGDIIFLNVCKKDGESGGRTIANYGGTRKKGNKYATR